MVELTDVGNRMFYSANTKPGTRPPPAVQVSRPHADRPPPRRRLATREEMIRYFGGAARVVRKDPTE